LIQQQKSGSVYLTNTDISFSFSNSVRD